MKILWGYIVLYILILVNTAFAGIVEISNLDAFKQTLKKVDLDTLVIFDVDHVLIMPTDESTLNRSSYRKQLWKEIDTKYSKEDAKVLRSIAINAAKWRLMDPDIVSILSNLKNKNIPTSALTSLSTGKVGIIEKMEDLRIKELQSVGIDFSRLTPFQGEILLEDLKSAHGIPMLKAGVILTAEVDKGKVLEHILLNKNYYPKRIIFIDDKLSNLEALEKLCHKLKIKFSGFHYTAIQLIPEPVVDEYAERLRFQILEQEHRWLSYQELADRINTKHGVVASNK